MEVPVAQLQQNKSQHYCWRLVQLSERAAVTPFTILILVCSMSLEPAACQPDTAVDVVQGPKVASEMQCGFLGQATIASTALAPRPGEEYLKVVCNHSGSTTARKAAYLKYGYGSQSSSQAAGLGS